MMAIDLARCERPGEPSEPVNLTPRDHQAQREREALKDAVDRLFEENPPPELTSEQIEKLRAILGRPTPERELMCWKLRLYCGHLIEQAAHYTHMTVHSAFTGSARCPECGLDPATIVAAEAVGLVCVPQQPPTARKRAIRPTREDLKRKVRALEAEVARLRRRQ
jgi:hypothetical protein